MVGELPIDRYVYSELYYIIFIKLLNSKELFKRDIDFSYFNISYVNIVKRFLSELHEKYLIIIII